MIYFVTGNEMKFREFFKIMGQSNDQKKYKIQRVNIDLKEIQGSSDDICIEKCKEAARMLKEPVIVEDVSLHLDALNGMPGPYIKHFLKTLGQNGIYDLVLKYHKFSAFAICTYAYFNPFTQFEPVLFSGTIEGNICEPRTQNNDLKNWDPIFIPIGYDKTFAEMSLDIKNSISHRSIAIKKLKNYLNNIL